MSIIPRRFHLLRRALLGLGLCLLLRARRAVRLSLTVFPGRPAVDLARSDARPPRCLAGGKLSESCMSVGWAPISRWRGLLGGRVPAREARARAKSGERARSRWAAGCLCSQEREDWSATDLLILLLRLLLLWLLLLDLEPSDAAQLRLTDHCVETVALRVGRGRLERLRGRV